MTAIPALMPLPSVGSRAFWPVAALNDDAELQAIEALQDMHYRRQVSSVAHTTQMALLNAQMHATKACTYSFNETRRRGTLLLAWRGSKALLQTLPASMKGGTA